MQGKPPTPSRTQNHTHRSQDELEVGPPPGRPRWPVPKFGCRPCSAGQPQLGIGRAPSFDHLERRLRMGAPISRV